MLRLPAAIRRFDWRALGCALAFSFLAFVQVGAVTMDGLLRDAKMNPKRFANKFGDFTFELFPYVQDPNVFLKTENGCCQDYAIMADYILSKKKFDTHMIRVVLVGGAAHDVCYVTQTGSYLDYNLRVYSRNLERARGTIRAIADKVADSFDENWTSASEFTYTYTEDVKRLALTVVKTDPPSDDPDMKLRP